MIEILLKVNKLTPEILAVYKVNGVVLTSVNSTSQFINLFILGFEQILACYEWCRLCYFQWNF